MLWLKYRSIECRKSALYEYSIAIKLTKQTGKCNNLLLLIKLIAFIPLWYFKQD